MDFYDFQLRAWPVDNEAVQILVHSSPVGGMDKPVSVPINPQQLEEIRRKANNALRSTPQSIVELGKQLSAILLPPPVYTRLMSSLNKIKPDTGIRIRLCLDPWLMDLPWEFLYDPGSSDKQTLDRFFVLRKNISLVRGIAIPAKQVKPSKRIQHMVFLGTLWSDGDRWQVKQTYARLTKTLELKANPKKFKLEEFMSADNDHIESSLTQPTSLFHYEGHTAVTNDGRGYLLRRCDPSANLSGDPMYSDQLGALLQKAGVKLAFFSACNSGCWAFVQPLVDAGLPLFIGAHGTISVQGSTVFSEKFYQSIVSGMSIDESIMAARYLLFERSSSLPTMNCEWGRYVVHMSTSGFALFSPYAGKPSPDYDQIDTGRKTKLEKISLNVVVEDNLLVRIDNRSKHSIPSDFMQQIEDDLQKIRKLPDNNPKSNAESTIDPKNLSNTEFLRRFGLKLFSALFSGEAEDLYRRAREMADTRSELVLRLTLQFNHLQLAELPWELMFDGDDFIAASHKNAVSRLLSKTTPSYTLKTPLRVLAVIANPGDLDGFKSLTIEEEKQILSGVLLKPNRERELQFVETKDTLETLGDRLSEFDANVVHFVCHGAEREGQYGLFLADKENHAIHRTVTDFGGCLRGRTDLRLVVLAACFSGTVRARKFLEGIASQLVENYNIPAVLAMQDSIDINQMHRFVQEFYEEFVKAYAIDHAVNKAREVLCDDRPQYPYFAIPVLYTSTSELDL